MADPQLLIDGDQYLFKACAAVEEEVQWDDQNHVLFSNAEKAWVNLEGMLERVFNRFGTADYILCFSAPDNFRKSLDETYKGNRSQRKPLCYARLRVKLDETYPTKVVPTLEADDVMGILATAPGKKERIIVSQDKDMKTIPGALWDGKDLVVYTEAEADYWHLYQTLIGDTSDGYKGCPKIGPAKAEKLLKDCPDAVKWLVVQAAYEKAGLTEADALLQARLARILRFSDWDAKKKEVKLWTP